MTKLKRGVSQTLRGGKIADALDGYVQNLSWHLDNLMVRCGNRANRRERDADHSLRLPHAYYHILQLT